MGAFVGLIAGIGALLIWRSGPRAPQRGAVRAGWATRRDELIRQAGIDSVSSAQLLGMQVLAAALAGLVIQFVTATTAVAACFTIFAFVGPVAVVRRLRQRRRVALRELWPEAIDNLASAVRAGMSLPEAISGLGTRGPEPLRPAFGRFAVAYRASGRFA
jgi:tight adherence protein B